MKFHTVTLLLKWVFHFNGEDLELRHVFVDAARRGATGVFLDQHPLHLLDWDPVKISVGAREFLGGGGGFGL